LGIPYLNLTKTSASLIVQARHVGILMAVRVYVKAVLMDKYAIHQAGHAPRFVFLVVPGKNAVAMVVGGHAVHALEKRLVYPAEHVKSHAPLIAKGRNVGMMAAEDHVVPAIQTNLAALTLSANPLEIPVRLLIYGVNTKSPMAK
jgi:hypothetical protein